MLGNPGDVQVFIEVGESELRIDSVRLDVGESRTVSVSFPLVGSTVTLTFDADRFVAFVNQLERFAATMPGKPS